MLTLFIILAVSTSCVSNNGTNIFTKELIANNFETLTDQSTYLRLKDISANKVTKKILNVSYNTFDVEKTSRGLFTLSVDQSSSNYYLSFFDTEINKVWDYKFAIVSSPIALVTDEYILIHTRQELIAIDYSGKELWSIENFQQRFITTSYFLDNNGGLFMLGLDYNTNEHTCMLYHISNTGEVLSCNPYDKAGNISPLQVFNDSNNDYWLLGTRKGGPDIRFLAHLDSDLNVDKKFELKQNQYPNVMLMPENDNIILYGQAYKDNPWTEYGFIYEIDCDCNQLAYKTFDTVPTSIIQMKDGRRIVSLYDRGNGMKDLVKIFDDDWNEIQNVNIQYCGTKLYNCDDGGFVITGFRLAPSQPYGALFRNCVQPKMDTIYERYDSDGNLICRETFFAEKSVDGNGYFILVADDGTLYLM